MKNKKLVIGIVVVILVAAGVFWLVKAPTKPGKYDVFAQCLADKGAKFYGTFWCPNCRNQKAMFGRSARLLPYIECSTPDGKGQLEICKNQKIEKYPTWEFRDGERAVGTTELEALAEKTSCTLPE